jgi:hypothetical protein
MRVTRFELMKVHSWSRALGFFSVIILSASIFVWWLSGRNSTGLVPQESPSIAQLKTITTADEAKPLSSAPSSLIATPVSDSSLALSDKNLPSRSQNARASSATPLVEQAGPTPRNAADLGGLPLEAQVQVGKAAPLALTPNEIGLFPRVLVEAKTKINISAAYTGARAGEQIVVSAEDGGQLDNGKPVMIAALGANGTVNFNFTTSADEGVFRVTLRKGADEKQFDFWVGPEPQLQK